MDAINTSIRRLRQFPRSGRPSVRIDGTRELIIPNYPYIVDYTYIEAEDKVVILRIRHGAQNLWEVPPADA